MTTWFLKFINKNQSFNDEMLSRYIQASMKVFLLILGFIMLSQISPALFDVIISTLGDAYLGVSVFVGVTLAAFYFLDRFFQSNLTRLLNEKGILQVPIAAMLGALPGCGGAIIVVTQFVHGQMSFGALVAVLIATMGDAAFLLIAKKPDIALLVYGLSLVAGIVFGNVVNWIHGDNHLKPKNSHKEKEAAPLSKVPTWIVHAFLVLLVPGIVLGMLMAVQFDTDSLLSFIPVEEPTQYIGLVGALLCILVWFIQPLNSWSARFSQKAESMDIRENIVAETSFITGWVIIGFLAYELLIHFSGLDIASFFVSLGALSPLLAILVGFIPGCGPQILMTTLYINGVVPFSSQLANAISNDGDALFPAIALAPKAALHATFYSAIPAFILGYSAYFMGF